MSLAITLTCSNVVPAFLENFDIVINLQTSWVDRMVTRVDNLKKRASRAAAATCSEDASPPTKKSKKSPKQVLTQRYPIGVNGGFEDMEDSGSSERHKRAIREEMEKTLPRDRVLLPLLKLTYFSRRAYIETEATSVSNIFEKFPALKRPAIVSKI